ncbi:MULTISPECIES: hypothetical protein [Vibrio]|uniref:hypothetical protein n=1 Tax=Vibrio TaxID=662 RepID=UPI0021A8398E|nr:MULTISPECIES: hypothetical protein [Vibrio]MDA0149818.1 hypothetical protein [Vibrio sp. LaRot3]
MLALGILAIALGVFFGSWVCQHGLPMMGLHVDTADPLLVSEVSGQEVLEA